MGREGEVFAVPKKRTSTRPKKKKTRNENEREKKSVSIIAFSRVHDDLD